jgi:hypothetical protein
MMKACLPEDFDLYPDLMAAGVDGTEHYMWHGFYERRPRCSARRAEARKRPELVTDST